MMDGVINDYGTVAGGVCNCVSADGGTGTAS
jgi:hypothetical protein